jgi:putative Holliday junction resolvase
MTRILALDVGERRIGLAIGDTETRLATPLRTLTRGAKPVDDAARIAGIAEEEDVEALVVGLPLTEAGEAGAQAQAVRAFAAHLARAVRFPLHWQDERYSTFEATQRLGPAGRSEKKRRQRREEQLDAMAATIILEAYFAAHRPPDGP